MMNKKNSGKISIIFAILAAALYAINAPASKVVLNRLSPIMMAGYLYLGAGLGMLILGFLRKRFNPNNEEKNLTKKELPYIVGMVLLDILAPIFAMLGLSMTTAANASLLNNFEIVATSIIALIFFKEVVPKSLWFAIFLVTIASIILSFEDVSSLSFSIGSIFVLLACICWGFENNCTRMLSSKDPLKIVVIKGIFSGAGSLIIGLVIGNSIGEFKYILMALLIGFVSYGLSIFFYVYAQRNLGAAKTSTYYAISPFIGVLLSFLLLGENPTMAFMIALAIMIVGTYFASTEGKKEKSKEKTVQ